MALDGSNIGGYHDVDGNIAFGSGDFPSIHGFLKGFSKEDREGILYGDDDILTLLNPRHVKYYMRNLSSGPHDISQCVKIVPTVSANVANIIYSDDLDVSFGGIDRKTMDNILSLESISAKFLKGEDMKHVEDCWYDIIEFLHNSYSHLLSDKMLLCFRKLKRKKTSIELQQIGLKVIQKLLINENSKHS